ncbi:MAG: extracellular solute-binding protein, partial [Oscillospiraceae bacterium]|nr:extracellular solute-binding protein [Oscillospiraceae bacterium]
MKKILALLLACLMLATLLTGCGQTAAVEEEAKPAQSSSSSGSAAAPAASEDKGEEPEEAEEKFTRFDELQEINVLIRVWADWEGKKEVFEEINKIAEEKLNIHMNFQTMAGEFPSQLPLMLTAGEVIDLSMVPWNFANMSAQNMLLPLDDYLEEYAPYIWETMQPYFPATTMNGQILAVPTLRMYNVSVYLNFRRDILDYLGLYDEAMALDSWSGVEALCLKVKEAQPDLPEELQTPIIFGQHNTNGVIVSLDGAQWASDKWSESKVCDYLGCNFLWVDDETNTVSNNYTSPEAKIHYDRMAKWYAEGLTSKDAVTNTESSDTLASNGMFFCWPSSGEYGNAYAKSNNVGRDICAVQIANQGLTTSYVSMFDWGLPVTCENPEAAVAAMNLFFEDVDVANLMVWGIRGRDYEVDDTGCAYKLEDGKYQALEWFQGNQFNSYPPQQPEGGAYRQNQWNDNVNGYISPYFGLVIDNTEIANELTAVQNVWDKYFPVLQQLEYSAYTLVWEYPQIHKEFDRCLREHVNSDEVRHKLY